jgi:23S rRNA U2552 (ribose-2'-O)-methylase RlmE/FtsJ
LLDSTVRPGSFLAYASADYYIQDSASMLPLQLLDLSPDDWVCDLCAAPGGKATAIAESLGEGGVLVANEVIAGRVDVLRYSLGRTGRANFIQTNLDPEQLAIELCGRFDKVLVDVPCSGQSLLGRDQQSESAFSDTHVLHCAARSQRILRQAMLLLRPGGRLIFSTCTFSLEENEDQVRWMLDLYPGKFHPMVCESLLSQSLTPWKSPVQEGAYRLWPHRDPCSGGFAAGLQAGSDWDPHQACADQLLQTKPINTPGEKWKERREDRGGRSHASKRKEKAGNRKNNTEGDQGFDELFEITAAIGKCNLSMEIQDSKIIGFERGAYAFHQEFPHIGQGTTLAAYKNVAPYKTLATNKPQSARKSSGANSKGVAPLEPYHAMAMLQSHLFESNSRVELDDVQAQRFVQGQAIEESSSQSVQAGWTLACWQGKPLGWLKGVAGQEANAGKKTGRWNNHLPVWARSTATAITQSAESSP